MSITKIELDKYLTSTSLLNMFSPLSDTYKNKFYNIFKSSIINDEISTNEYLFESYTVTYDDWLDNISNIYYNTPYLWWVVAMFNGINNPFEELIEGSVLKILRYQYIHILINDVISVGKL